MFAVESGGVLTRSTQILSQVRLAEDYRCSVRAGARPLIIAAQPPSPSSAGAGPSISEARENFPRGSRQRHHPRYRPRPTPV